MRQLKTLSVAPPGGWRYTDPDTGFLYGERSHSLSALLEQVRKYRSQNKLDPIPDLEMVVSEWLCYQPDVAFKTVPTPRTANQYLRGGVAMFRAMTSKEPFCSQAVAEKRAEICARCRYNEPPEDKGLIESMTDVAIQSIVGGRKTKLNRQLFICTVCSCPLKAKVHFAQDIVDEELTEQERYRVPNGFPGKDNKPLYCWQINPIKEDK